MYKICPRCREVVRSRSECCRKYLVYEVEEYEAVEGDFHPDELYSYGEYWAKDEETAAKKSLQISFGYDYDNDRGRYVVIKESLIEYDEDDQAVLKSGLYTIYDVNVEPVPEFVATAVKEGQTV